jgi:hypothetical protein
VASPRPEAPPVTIAAREESIFTFGVSSKNVTAARLALRAAFVAISRRTALAKGRSPAQLSV